MKIMPYITAIILAAFISYSALWYFGILQGDFSLLLFIASVITGVYWILEKLIFVPNRKKQANILKAAQDERKAALSAQGIVTITDEENNAAQEKLLMQPWWLDWTAGLFPVIITIFILRSFIFEPFRIPSGSMIPTLHIGDLILVNKFTYGIKLPVINKKITEGNEIKRSDVVVFKYPVQPNVDYIKRVVGIAGDEIAYENKQLYINGKVVPLTQQPDFFDTSTSRYFSQFGELLAAKNHKIIQDPRRSPYIDAVENFPYRDNCSYSANGIKCKVPKGHYFVMGDNRDNSLDSRYWGFVPDENIVGKAFFVWMNLGDLSRIGSIN